MECITLLLLWVYVFLIINVGKVVASVSLNGSTSSNCSLKKACKSPAINSTAKLPSANTTFRRSSRVTSTVGLRLKSRRLCYDLATTFMYRLMTELQMSAVSLNRWVFSSSHWSLVWPKALFLFYKSFSALRSFARGSWVIKLSKTYCISVRSRSLL